MKRSSNTKKAEEVEDHLIKGKSVKGALKAAEKEKAKNVKGGRSVKGKVFEGKKAAFLNRPKEV
jgi:hypothetical protein